MLMMISFFKVLNSVCRTVIYNPVKLR